LQADYINVVEDALIPSGTKM